MASISTRNSTNQPRTASGAINVAHWITWYSGAGPALIYAWVFAGAYVRRFRVSNVPEDVLFAVLVAWFLGCLVILWRGRPS